MMHYTVTCRAESGEVLLYLGIWAPNMAGALRMTLHHVVERKFPDTASIAIEPCPEPVGAR